MQLPKIKMPRRLAYPLLAGVLFLNSFLPGCGGDGQISGNVSDQVPVATQTYVIQKYTDRMYDTGFDVQNGFIEWNSELADFREMTPEELSAYGLANSFDWYFGRYTDNIKVKSMHAVIGEPYDNGKEYIVAVALLDDIGDGFKTYRPVTYDDLESSTGEWASIRIFRVDKINPDGNDRDLFSEYKTMNVQHLETVRVDDITGNGYPDVLFKGEVGPVDVFCIRGVDPSFDLEGLPCTYKPQWYWASGYFATDTGLWDIVDVKNLDDEPDLEIITTNAGGGYVSVRKWDDTNVRKCYYQDSLHCYSGGCKQEALESNVLDKQLRSTAKGVRSVLYSPQMSVSDKRSEIEAMMNAIPQEIAQYVPYEFAFFDSDAGGIKSFDGVVDELDNATLMSYGRELMVDLFVDVSLGYLLEGRYTAVDLGLFALRKAGGAVITEAVTNLVTATGRVLERTATGTYAYAASGQDHMWSRSEPWGWRLSESGTWSHEPKSKKYQDWKVGSSTVPGSWLTDAEREHNFVTEERAQELSDRAKGR